MSYSEKHLTQLGKYKSQIHYSLRGVTYFLPLVESKIFLNFSVLLSHCVLVNELSSAIFCYVLAW